MSDKTGGNQRTGGQVLIDQLRIHGVDMAFCVPGESYLAALDALYDAPEIKLIVARHDGSAAMMAEAYGKLTGRPGIAFVTRGPGATNASAGVHIAFQDSTPMILFIGQVARDMNEREAFQEIDFRRMFGQMAKWVAEIEDAKRIPEFVSRAFHTATSGRPGPVVLALPEDMLTDRVGVADARRYRTPHSYPAPEDMQRLSALLAKAQRPLAILGGGDWTAQAVADFQDFAQRFQIPVSCSYRAQSHFDNSHPCYVGDSGIGPNPKLAQRILDADVLLVVGARLGEITTSSYTLIEPPVPKQKLVHIYPDPEEIGRVYQTELGMVANMASFAAAAKTLPAPSPIPWAASTVSARADYLAWIKPETMPGNIQLGEIVEWLCDYLPPEAIVTNGAGNYSGWLHRHYRWRRYRTQLAPTSGTMGYGVPAAVAAKALLPDRPVVSFAGDGCFLMHGQEFATAVQYGLPMVFVVVNNGMYGTIRMHQEREYPARISGTALKNPDFAKLAEAFGGHDELVRTTADFPAAFKRAEASRKPAILELRIDPEAITPRATITSIREAAIKAGR